MPPLPEVPTGNRRGVRGRSGTFAAAVGGHGRSCAGRGRALAASALCGLALAGCGGEERQDADEPEGSFPVEVTAVEFPREQRLADRAQFVVEVRNTGNRTIPNIAVTLDGLDRVPEREDVAGAQRPIWVLESGPEGAVTAYVDTWAKGALPPGKSARFEWDVTVVAAGTHRLGYRVSAGLDGNARARGRDGRPPDGEVTVAVSEEPADARVDPETGAVVRGDDRDARDDQAPDPDQPLDLFEEDRGGE